MPTLFTFTEPGGHVVNEDAFEARPHPLDPGCTVCFLADGMGGQAGGGLAARTACRAGIDLACGLPCDRLRSPDAWTSLLDQVDEAVQAADGAGYTTLVSFRVMGGTLVGASAGDSALLVISANERPSILTVAQHKNPPVGSGGAAFVPFAAKLAPPWRVLAMTDGVWKYVGWERVIQIVSAESGSSLIERLQESARIKGSGKFQDDFTVVMLETAS